MIVDTPFQLLIVEDESDTGTMLQEYFDLQGYEVRVIAWGTDAVARCRTHPPDLILLDVRLPDIDGYEVFARLRQQTHTQHTPVIFLTKQQGRDDRIRGLELGAVDYITKPFDLEELSLRVRNALLVGESPHTAGLVTDLPIEPEMEDLLRPLTGEDKWAALYFRLHNLESIAHTHGSPTGDEALRAVVNVLDEVVAELGGPQDFVTHLNEADFVLMTSPQRVKMLRERIVARLPHALRRFTGPQRKEAEDGAATPLFSIGIGLLADSRLSPD